MFLIYIILLQGLKNASLKNPKFTIAANTCVFAVLSYTSQESTEIMKYLESLNSRSLKISLYVVFPQKATTCSFLMF